MKKLERKALDLVLDARVEVKHVTFDQDGRIVDGYGMVQGDGGMYTVTIDGNVTTCTCQYGQAREDATGHSHDLALRLAAQQERGTDETA